MNEEPMFSITKTIVMLLATFVMLVQMVAIGHYQNIYREACSSACERRGSLTERFSSGEVDREALMCYCPDGTELHMDVGAMWVEND